MSVNVVWSETSLDADNRSHYAIATLVNHAFDRAELGCIHRNGFHQLPPDADGAIVVIHGEHEVRKAAQVLENINRLKWAVSIVIGDDWSVFPTEYLRGSRRKVWQQMPIPGVHDWVDRKLICGYAHDTENWLAHYEEQKRYRTLDWFFAGQINHPGRKQCVTQLKMIPCGFLHESPAFWSGLSRAEYFQKLASCKIAPCPSGAATPDTIRLAEALEAGCVPIAEDKWPPTFPRKNFSPGKTGYWRYVLGEEPPFPILNEWHQLPPIYDQVMCEWPENQRRLQSWWADYKQKMWRWLTEDVNAVR